MRFKGKLTKWHTNQAFGFIAPNNVVSQGFIHQSAFDNKTRIPQISDIITFSITKDKAGQYCACDATF
jgi:cold shock CspA family protein